MPLNVTMLKQPLKTNPRAWILLALVGVVAGAICLAGPWAWRQATLPEPPAPPQAVVGQPTWAHFQYLRQAELMGNRIVMLRHTPTSQRVLVLRAEDAAHAAAYQSLYNRPLTPFEFRLILPLFQHQTGYRQHRVDVTGVTLNRSERVHEHLRYKQYTIMTDVDGESQEYAAYVAMIGDSGQPHDLVFTFNRKPAALLSPVTDFYTDSASRAPAQATTPPETP